MPGDYKYPGLEDLMHGTVTIVKSCGKNDIQGTGFLYTSFDDPKSNGLRTMIGMWLVTCRHIIIPKDGDGISHLADKIEFMIREVQDDGTVGWLGISVSGSELRSSLRIHPDPDVDVVVIDVFDRMMNLMKRVSDRGSNLLRPDGIKNMHLPECSKIQVHGGDDVVVIGFPRGLYDDVNKFPVLKNGMVASRWGFKFNGKPMFLLDAKLLEGSSGSPVVTKPTHFAVDDGKLLWSEMSQYVFLGVYSGNYAPSDVEDDDRYDQYCLGEVWYSDLVPWIIDNGVKYSDDHRCVLDYVYPFQSYMFRNFSIWIVVVPSVVLRNRDRS